MSAGIIGAIAGGRRRTSSPLAAIKTSMISWLDFAADGSDSHTAGPYNFTEVGTPVYSGGKVAVSGANSFRAPAGWLTAMGDNGVDKTMLLWVKTGATQAPGNYFWKGQQNGTYSIYGTTSSYPWSRLFGIVNISNLGGMAVSTDYLIGLTYNAGSTTVKTILGTSQSSGSTDTPGSFDTFFYLPSTNTGSDYYWFAAWNRILTTEEIAALYAAGSSLTYADLP